MLKPILVAMTLELTLIDMQEKSCGENSLVKIFTGWGMGRGVKVILCPEVPPVKMRGRGNFEDSIYFFSFDWGITFQRLSISYHQL